MPAFRVGVTGHRPNGLSVAELPLLRERIRGCLASARDIVRSRHGADAHLVVVSPLAEGADRLVAEEGLALGFRLCAPLPFQRDEYEQDFRTPASRKQFRRLLDRADDVLELDGTREHGAGAYTLAGRTVLDLSDLVIAIWDGREARGDGGTGQMVLEAIHRPLPTVWIRAEPPHEACLLSEDRRHGTRKEPLDRLPERLFGA